MPDPCPERESEFKYVVLSTSRTWHVVHSVREDNGWAITECNRVVKPRKFGHMIQGKYNLKFPGPGRHCYDCQQNYR